MPQLAVNTAFVEVQGKKIQLIRHGEGPPLLYLHSAAGEAEWEPFHQQLAEHFEVRLPAHPGFCLSTGLDQVHDVADLAWHYVDLIESQGWGPLPIVGFSLGAWIAMELAILRPQLVTRLVLVDAAGVHVPEAPVAELFLDDFDELRQLLFFDPRSAVARHVIPESVEDPRILNWLRAREATARVGWNPYLHNPRLPKHLRRITCPVRILWGREDRLIPPPHGEFLAERLPHAELRVFEQCGHMLPFEMPDRFTQEVTEFFRLGT